MGSLSTEAKDEVEFQRDLDKMYRLADAFFASAGLPDLRQAAERLSPVAVAGSPG